MQALLLHPDPRILVCAPSNAAADVLALRLLERLPQLAERMQATRDADVAADADAGAGTGDVAAVAAAEAEAGEGEGEDEQVIQLNLSQAAIERQVPRAAAKAEAEAKATAKAKAKVAAAAAARESVPSTGLASLPSSRRRWYQNAAGSVVPIWASGGGGGVLRLNAQQRVGTPVGLMKICAQDTRSDHFTVPSVSVLATKRVVICTCGAAHLLVEAGYPSSLWRATTPDRRSPLPRFTHLLIDEASQALEPEMMLPLALATPEAVAPGALPAAGGHKLGCNVVLSGDHKQLGPVVRAPFCRDHGLATSLLERLMTLPLYAPLSSPRHSPGPGPAGGDAAELPPAPVGARARCMTKLLNNYRSHGALLTRHPPPPCGCTPLALLHAPCHATPPSPCCTPLAAMKP